MRRGTGLLATAVLSALAALVLSASASAATFSGVVIHHNSHAHSFVVAGGGGKLFAVHAKRVPALGWRVRVQARHLINGTWASQRIQVLGRTRRVKVRGTVTHVDRAHHRFVLSARGVSLLVNQRHARSHRAGTSSAALPGIGEVVSVDGSVSGNGIDASGVHSEGQDQNGIDLEGTIKAIDPSARTLTLSADDQDSSPQSLTVDVPASFDLTKFSVGEDVELIVSLNPDGTYTLQQASDDSNAAHAGNPGDNQGDGQGDQQPSAEQQCRSQQGDPNFASAHNGLSFTEFWETNPNEPNDAFGRCVDGMAHGTPSSPSPELQCHTEHSDPSFPASHNGQSFAQFYNPSEPTNLNDAYGRCIDSKSQHSGGSESGGSGAGGSDSSGGSGSAGGSDSSGGPGSAGGPGSSSGSGSDH